MLLLKDKLFTRIHI